MTTHKNIDRICCAVLALILILTLMFVNAESLGVQAVSADIGYESRLFDTSRVHTIDIVMDDWDEFIETCENEEYADCSVFIDNDAYKNVGIRAKGNTSLSSVSAYGNDRYSFKIEFDCYDKTKSYYGLDKINLNNIIQDNTYMKDYLCYQMMTDFDVASPLCSYVYITVNGEDWGLYLAVEGVEESFLERNYGNDYGELYKPDSMKMGGGGNLPDMGDMGNMGDMDFSDMDFSAMGNPPDGFNPFDQNGGMGDPDAADDTDTENDGNAESNTDAASDTATANDTTAASDSSTTSDTDRKDTSSADWESMKADMGGKNFSMGGIGGMSMGGDDVSLIYTDDEYDSYSDIFDNAKTDITDTDKDRLIASLKKLNEGEDIESAVNIEEVIRYFVVHNFVCNFDSYTGSIIHNYYLYEEDGQMSMIPWDYNLAFGGFQSMGNADSLVNYPIDSPVSGGTIDSRPMLSWIFSNEEYTELYHEYFQEFITEYFDSGYFEETIDTVTEMIAPYVEKDPTKFCTYEEFENGAATLKEFCLLRSESISAQLDGTIPSTSDGQSADNTALIDASSITISDMGSMGNMDKGGNMGKNDAVSAAAVQPENSQETAGSQPVTDGESSPPQLPEGADVSSFQPPTDAGSDSTQQLMDTGSTSTQQPPNTDSTSAQQSTGTDSASTQQPPDADSGSDSSQQQSSPGNMEMPEGFDGNFPGNMNQDGGGRSSMPKDNAAGAQTANSTITIILLAVSAAFLAIGLIFAFKFKR